MYDIVYSACIIWFHEGPSPEGVATDPTKLGDGPGCADNSWTGTRGSWERSSPLEHLQQAQVQEQAPKGPGKAPVHKKT